MSGVSNGVACPVCTRPLSPDTWNLDFETYCPTCRAPVTVRAFPGLLQPEAGATPEIAIAGEEATCFYHARKKAAVACDQCGRFVCALCGVQLAGQNWCPACIDAHRRQGRLGTLDSARILYDNVALLLALGPIVLVFTWGLTIFTAPAALFVVIRYWRAPLSLVPRTRVRFVAAGAGALLALAGWVFILFSAFVAIRSRL